MDQRLAVDFIKRDTNLIMCFSCSEKKHLDLFDWYYSPSKGYYTHTKHCKQCKKKD